MATRAGPGAYAGAVVVEQWSDASSGERSAAFLAELRDRLQRQSAMPALPPGWHCHSAMLPAHGFEYGGDFFVAEPAGDGDLLQMVLVDVCGHGPSAVPDAVQFAGALGALVVALPPEEVMAAANRYLLRRAAPEAIATAVQVLLRLGTGSYRIRSAGHPPVLHWDPAVREWLVDGARGTALGATEEPALEVSTGVLGPGEALLFYTDGVVESRGQDVDAGIEWLRTAARDAVAAGFAGAAPRILAGMEPGEDDRAVLIIGRDPA